MTEIQPTPEHLSDPYVLQLIQALSQQQDLIETLENGACRFHCRVRADMWKAGFNWGFNRPGVGDADEEYNNWRTQHDKKTRQGTTE